MNEKPSEQLTIEVSADVLTLLAVLGDPKEVIGELVDHAQQGVYRPGSWERGWLEQVFGDEWQAKLEADPEAPFFQRPKVVR